MNRRYLLLATGGTIASVPMARGLAPAKNAEDILREVPQLLRGANWRGEDVFSLDSSNIQPEEWRTLAKITFERLQNADGALITHGTDTLAYTAAALSFMLRGLQKPVILTGSQLPLSAPFSDAPLNLLEAAAALGKAPGGVYVLFHHKLILGTRAVKLRTTAFDAFDSVNAPLAGEFSSDGLTLSRGALSLIKPAERCALQDAITSRVFLLKLMPGTAPDVFDWIADKGFKGVVIEAFGLGGLHYIRRNLVDKLKLLSSRGIITVVVSQCLYEHADFSVYEVGRDVLSGQVFSGGDMTTEAAVAKLMWVLGDRENRLKLLKENLCGEMNVGQ